MEEKKEDLLLARLEVVQGVLGRIYTTLLGIFGLLFFAALIALSYMGWLPSWESQ